MPAIDSDPVATKTSKAVPVVTGRSMVGGCCFRNSYLARENHGNCEYRDY